MKSKSYLLTAISIIAFLALSAIQVHLVYNTYTLKKNAFISNVNNKMSSFDRVTTLDSISNTMQDYLLIQIRKYLSGEISKQEAINISLSQIDSLNLLYNSICSKELKYQKVLESAVILGNTNDTFVSIHKTKPLRFIGDDFLLDNAHILNISRNLSHSEYQQNGELITNSVELKFRDYVKIIDEKSIIIRQMNGILLGSFIIFLIVISLFYYSLKTLSKQRKINSIKTDFINNITHELKTPLTTIQVGTKSLRKIDIQQDTDVLNVTLNTIDRQNRRLQQLIDQVIHKSVKAEDIQLQFEKVDLIPFIRNLVIDYKVGTSDNNVKIITSYSLESLQVNIDKFHLTTALLNILQNALKYNKGEKVIHITVFIEKNQVLISIKDNGIGIPKKELKNIFDKFYRISQGDIHEYKSLGLGLYYTLQIIKSHKGSVTVKSKLNVGSNFTIKLPINYE